VPSYTVERDIAAALRDWLFETVLEYHDETDSAESLGDLAVMIDRKLQKQTNTIELSVTARLHSVSPHDNSSGGQLALDDQRPIQLASSMTTILRRLGAVSRSTIEPRTGVPSAATSVRSQPRVGSVRSSTLAPAVAQSPGLLLLRV
jgi:hypothetical protein